jgi:preprotein translocase subunit SecA
VVQVLNLDAAVDDWAKEEGIAEDEIRERLRKMSDEAYTGRTERNSPR